MENDERNGQFGAHEGLQISIGWHQHVLSDAWVSYPLCLPN